ncbi:hypothetical protein LTS10_010709 [Elasticomyces elasticus]|nr:hypothetical protein LTS10_010709 [Elasticomyces elasticus]
MAEITGLIVGILPIFNAVLEDVHYIQIGRDFKGRYCTTMIRLSNAEVRLIRWGKIVYDRESSMDAKDHVDSINEARPTLIQLRTLLEQARKRSAPYDEGSKVAQGTTEAVQDLQVQSLCQDMTSLCSKHVRDLKLADSTHDSHEKDQPKDTKRASVADKLRKMSLKSEIVRGMKWALLDEHIIEKLVADTAALMADLESLWPAARVIQLDLGADIEQKINALLAQKDDELTKVLNELKTAAACQEPTTAPISNVTNTWTGTNTGGIQSHSVSVGGNLHLGMGK